MTDVVTKISESFGCKAVEGMLSYQMEKDTIDGKKTIIQNPTEKQRQEHEKVSHFPFHTTPPSAHIPTLFVYL